MCVNDIIVQGAEPLFFLDYYATGHLDVNVGASVIEGIGKGCELAGCALVGGETAEMPGMYQAGDYDLAGFCVGIVEKSMILDGSRIQAGERLIGIASSGPHSNGYSLIRKILERAGQPADQSVGERSIIELLMEPTRIYVKSLLKLMETIPVHALAHITGGGITENLPRVLPKGMAAQIDLAAWPRLPVFDWLKDQGRVEQAEMLKTFNCGIGMMVCVAPADEATALAALKSTGEQAYAIGEIVPGDADPVVTYLSQW
jgi:phosphoribosylformylglycinamidine cyclo-ligase